MNITTQQYKLYHMDNCYITIMHVLYIAIINAILQCDILSKKTAFPLVKNFLKNCQFLDSSLIFLIGQSQFREKKFTYR